MCLLDSFPGKCSLSVMESTLCGKNLLVREQILSCKGSTPNDEGGKHENDLILPIVYPYTLRPTSVTIQVVAFRKQTETPLKNCKENKYGWKMLYNSVTMATEDGINSMCPARAEA